MLNFWFFLLRATTLKIWTMFLHRIVVYIFWSWMKNSKFTIFTKYVKTFKIFIHCLVSIDSKFIFSNSTSSHEHVVFCQLRFIILFSRSVFHESFLKIQFRFQNENNKIVIANQNQRIRKRFSDSTKWFNAQRFLKKKKNTFLSIIRTNDFDNALFITFCKLKSILWDDLKSKIMNEIVVICVHCID